MITFSPGPSQLDAHVATDLREIHESGLLSASHRTAAVQEIVRGLGPAMRRVTGLSDDYALVLQPSATAAMDLILANCAREASLHLVAGAFAERFAQTADALGLARMRAEGPLDHAFDWRAVTPDPAPELVALTHNETSTGAMWPADDLAGVRARWPEALLAIDVTSSFGAVQMDFGLADVLFGSVQKGLGLPAGLGFVLAGPRAIARATEIGAKRRVAPWRDLPRMAEKLATGNTVETPNVLGIALLARRLARLDLAAEHARTLDKAELIAGADLPWTPFMEAAAWRSPTVHTVRVGDPAGWHARAANAGFTLGKGYGKHRADCIRIANFPAHTLEDVERLLAALRG